MLYVLQGIPFENLAEAVTLAGMVILLLMIAALAGFAYKSLRDDGIEWPDDREEDTDEGVSKGGDDDEWEYY